MGHFLKTELNQTIFIKGWDAITYPYPNFNGDLTKSYPTEKIYVIIHPCGIVLISVNFYL